MKKYLIKGSLFLIPVFLYMLFIFVVDPYNFFNVFHVISDKDKFRIIQRTDESSPRGNILWKTVKFRRSPVSNVIIGDSQGKDINVDLVQEITGENYFNFCFPGASFKTMFETFWFTADQVKLEKIYFQVAFMNYNAEREYDLFHFANDYFKRPYQYFTTKEIFFDSFMNVAWVATRNPWIVSRSYEYLPPDKMEDLAQFRLNLFFEEYSYPKTYMSELQKIKEYCEQNNIELTFVILPVYEGVDKHLEKVGLTDAKNRFKADINSLGKTIDLDKLKEVKANRGNFIDYFHPNQAMMDSLVKQIWVKG
ncbi:MAG: hypothetical protein CVU14_04060 [Bacteroidetes bacterium HGW-Bacteroidetes-9]|jgi:hypothetical protein|nr:MAG: hypothetical protein CVU14_04060 [Bacteroidetes bacterium HGW-Bacteroidetes-9]